MKVRDAKASVKLLFHVKQFQPGPALYGITIPVPDTHVIVVMRPYTTPPSAIAILVKAGAPKVVTLTEPPTTMKAEYGPVVAEEAAVSGVWAYCPAKVARFMAGKGWLWCSEYSLWFHALIR